MKRWGLIRREYLLELRSQRREQEIRENKRCSICDQCFVTMTIGADFNAKVPPITRDLDPYESCSQPAVKLVPTHSFGPAKVCGCDGWFLLKPINRSMISHEVS